MIVLVSVYCVGKVSVTVEEAVSGLVAQAVVVKLLVVVRS